MNDAFGSVQSVLVLGGTSDIARATVRKLVGERCRTVILAGRDVTALETAAEEARQAGATTVDVVEFDAARTDTHETFVADVFARPDDIDVVLLAFGLLGDQELAEQDAREAIRVGQVNYVGAMSVSLPVASRLRDQGHGTLVVLSSVAGERARRANFVYGSSKAGLDAFAQGLADSLVGSGARVLVVRPGFVATKMTEGMDPAPLSTTPEAVADAIVRGLGSHATTIWVPGLLRYVMSVLRHVPRAIFRRLPV
ncbi:MAG TPA: decaprenylphospho-beta-D-erythro-pentofuranosid-2-ulose 2-reductase [Acidimicrobiia bacterium]|nr:decaprenylphospho-beta-D-erythro-pentofuranosid-2-ulose 2-reductase [Acidimicrobiia bacterium]